jgi:ribulose-5-phosphate 4-epimerase/fuculose-1-phosphate aldolase
MNAIASLDHPVASTSIRESVSPEEWQTRVDLAAAYRLVALFGWDDLVFTHISAKVPGTHHFLINPYGAMFEEITASSLVKIDIEGNKVPPLSNEQVNPAGFVIHSCIHAARDEVHCVLHTHSINGVAVSAQKNGLLPISQFAMSVLPSLAYHDYEGFAVEDDEKPRLVRDLGSAQHLMLRSHGLLTVGRSVAEAFIAMHRFEASCMTQIRAQSGGAELIDIPQTVLAGAREQIAKVRNGRGADLVWPGLLRRLDRRMPGYDT